MDFSARLLKKYLLIWLVLLSLTAYYWGALVSGSVLAGWDPFISSKPCLPYLIAATMFAIGCMLPREEVRQVIHHWPRVLCGTAIQYSVMPALAWSVGHLWGMEGDQLVGVVMVGCVPGAMASNVLTLNARGNTSYSVGLTTAATLLSPLIVPLVLRLTLVSGESIPASKVWEASYLLLLMVVLPVIAGHLSVIFMPKLESSARRAGPMVANLVILWIIAVIVGLNRGLLATRDVNLMSALLAINVMGYGAGYLSGWAFRFQEPLRRALTLEVGMQNAGLGATLATQLFPERDGTAIAPALYTFGCMLTGSVLAQYWSGRFRRVVVSDEESAEDSSVETSKYNEKEASSVDQAFNELLS